MDLAGIIKPDYLGTDDEFTELVDADIPRVDLVDKAANGMRFLIAKGADGARGLMDPAFVRDLIAKADPAVDPDTATTTAGGMVTMTGSPAAIVRFIHEASVRQTGKPVAKAEMSTAEIDDLPDSVFGYIEPGGTKDDSGRTTPRSLRHFPLHDKAHVQNALSRAPQSPFGDKAMPKIRAAAEKFRIEVSKEMAMDDDLDPTVTLAEPAEDMPGIPTNPGSPAWEAVDAATARKWTAILARARNAIDLLADREMLEAAAGDGEDVGQAMDLEDACCAIDYAISVLAPFAVAEQAEADCGDEMAAVGKALDGWDPAPLDTIEALSRVAKAGRVLSAANEAAIRDAVDKLQKVLASLPAPIEKESGQPVADAKETEMPQPTTSAETAAEHGAQPQMGAAKDVAKADGEGKAAMRAVYDAKGRLVGIVDPADITPIEDATPEPDGADGAAAEAPDLEPAPPGEVGTPADAVPDGVTKTSAVSTTSGAHSDTASEAVLKGIADVVKAQFDAYQAAQQEVVAKQGETLAALTEAVGVLKDQVRVLEEQPAESKVFTNGAVPPAHHLRGQDQGAPPVDVARAAELRKTLYAGSATEQNRAAIDLQALAIAQLREIHERR